MKERQGWKKRNWRKLRKQKEEIFVKNEKEEKTEKRDKGDIRENAKNKK